MHSLAIVIRVYELVCVNEVDEVSTLLDYADGGLTKHMGCAVRQRLMQLADYF
jgi:hypothetical protein